jgi:hypothetical protein
MNEPNRHPQLAAVSTREDAQLPSVWREFIRFCGDLKHGEIERLSIQDGVPVLAEITKKKIKFNGRP